MWNSRMFWGDENKVVSLFYLKSSLLLYTRWLKYNVHILLCKPIISHVSQFATKHFYSSSYSINYFRKAKQLNKIILEFWFIIHGSSSDNKTFAELFFNSQGNGTHLAIGGNILGIRFLWLSNFSYLYRITLLLYQHLTVIDITSMSFITCYSRTMWVENHFMLSAEIERARHGRNKMF